MLHFIVGKATLLIILFSSPLFRMHAVEKKVRAFVRVKPTAQFAQDVIKFGPDNKVDRNGLRVQNV